MSPSPALSIIVPTHNRSALLVRNLHALAHQSWPAEEFEVIVVADACDDDTAERVNAYMGQAPYRLQLLSHRARCAAATRNLGASNAQGAVLLFLDDDVVAEPQLVQAHMEAQRPTHALAPRRVVLGYSKPVVPPEPSWWQLDARRWWEDSFRAMAQPGHRFTYRDFFSGNVSMSATLFHEVGGFDASITGRLEDYELGMRLIKAGVRFHFEPQAIGHHHESSDLDRWLYRIQQEGGADIQIGQRHPELRTSSFGFVEPRHRQTRLMRHLAFANSRKGGQLYQRLRRQATRYERFKLRGRWRKAVRLMREYNYWRGVASAIGGRRELAAWLQEAPMPPAVAGDAPCIDLSALPPADALDQVLLQGSHKGIRVELQGTEVLALPPQPGAEPLSLEFLCRALQTRAERQFLPALALHLIQTRADITSPVGASLLWPPSSPIST